uniref:Uncharacterized protein n=1 Tax=Medicago truncatula TaxID=3880 RepID=I3SJX9_MEDTR|nr:unknown [Medicago truncatula]
MDKLKATQSWSMIKVMRRRKTSIVKPFVGAAVETTTRMNFGLAVIFVRGGTMENV